MYQQDIPKPRPFLLAAEILLAAIFVSMGLVFFYAIGSANASTVVDPGADPGGFLEQSYQAVKSGDWVLVASLALICIVWVARKPWALGRIKFFTTDRGGVVMAFVLSAVGGLGHALAATGKAPDLDTLKMIATTAIGAMGGYVALKRLIWPSTNQAAPPPALPPA